MSEDYYNVLIYINLKKTHCLQTKITTPPNYDILPTIRKKNKVPERWLTG